MELECATAEVLDISVEKRKTLLLEWQGNAACRWRKKRGESATLITLVADGRPTSMIGGEEGGHKTLRALRLQASNADSGGMERRRSGRRPFSNQNSKFEIEDTLSILSYYHLLDRRNYIYLMHWAGKARSPGTVFGWMI